MGLFKKKEAKKYIEELPELPKIPKLLGLPELPDDDELEKTLPKLPEYSLNNEFSKNTLKKAVTGKEEEMFGADEFVREQMMPEHREIARPERRLEFPREIDGPKNFELRRGESKESRTKKSGQVFIKIDKFEESLKIFELTKNKITEMEKMLEDIKKLKEKEERELSYWMAEIQTIKNQTEKVERDIFSKLE